ncbi:hypothetical protein [Armatimonas rosea]|uniref:Uncharacterized protein n=1 Tax=Armatimonas rosea TaxID=685828 RepID=A0A7W9W5I3_ARMRO|nr:hypothetical protein [Armatimonas rosea]MBB6048945.1 hypothetical protein [Armatimonas rosea]
MKWLTTLAAALLAVPALAQTPPPPPPDAVAAPTAAQSASSNNRYLLLPDISFISMVKGLFTSDKTNTDRNKFLFDSGELAVQSFVYPGIKQDAFIVFGNGEAVVEEGYVTVQDLHVGKLPLSATVGRRKAPFGRVNQLHPHSWAYIEPPTVLKNLVADESLTGDGGYLSYLFPTKFFLQLDAGYWGQPTPVEDTAADGPGPTSGAGFRDTFGTLRLWMSHRLRGGDLELGASDAQGKGIGYAGGGSPQTTLHGLDLTYRTTALDSQRVLVRSEWLSHEQKGGSFVPRRAEGYYISVDKRQGPLHSIGLRYDDSGSPWSFGREKSFSLIQTHQLTEQTYLRLQATHGDRPGQKGFNELRLQWVWGVGPHTHGLE